MADDHTPLQLLGTPAPPPPLGAPIEADANTTRAIAFSPDGRSLITGSNDTTCACGTWATPPLELAPAFPSLATWDAVRSAIYSPDGSLVASGSDDRTATLWDVRTSKPTVPPSPATGTPSPLSPSAPDGKRLSPAATTTPCACGTWPPAAPSASPSPATPLIRCAAWPSVQMESALVSGGWDDTLIIWDVARPPGGPAPRRPRRPGTQRRLQPRRPGDPSAGEDGTLRLWDAATGAPSASRWPATATPSPRRFTQAGGDRIVSISLDRSLRLWNPRTTSPVGAPSPAAAGGSSAWR